MSVLIVVDRDENHQVALPRGLELAKAMGWDAEAVAFCYETTASLDPAEQREAQRRVETRCRESLEAQVGEHALPGVDVKPVAVWEKSVHQWINAHVQENHVDAVVKTGHRSETFLYTPTDWHLLRECAAPVLLVADRAWHPMRSIVAAVDFGSRSRVKQDLNDAVVRTAKALADAMSHPLYVVYVIHVSTLLRDLDVIDERAHVDKIRRRLAPEIAAFAERNGITEDHIRIQSGEVHRVLPSMAARLQAQLVVMGTVGRLGVTARVIGNTAERVLTRLGADVLALKPGKTGFA